MDEEKSKAAHQRGLARFILNFCDQA